MLPVVLILANIDYHETKLEEACAKIRAKWEVNFLGGGGHSPCPHLHYSQDGLPVYNQLECGPMPNLMVALPNVGGALCSTPQTLADAHY